MIFKILASSSTFHAVDYSEKKTKQATASLMHFDNFGPLQDGRTEISKSDFVLYLKKWSERNERIRNPQFHATLSCKGKELSHDILKEKALEIMDRLGYAGIPILIYAHKDTDNNHVHIVTSRVGEDGKKVAHQFERKRSNQILNTLMGLQPDQEYKAHIENAISYNFSTQAQFVLLMEKEGYNVKANESSIAFYKHGKKQGNFPISVLQNQIAENKPKENKALKNKIISLVHKYSKAYDSTIVKNSRIEFSSRQIDFRSDLTDMLKVKFGLDFVFFSGKENSSAYGYSIIDHNNKAVFKGSEIMKLDLLSKLSSESEGQSGKQKSMAEEVTVNTRPVEDQGNFVLNHEAYHQRNHELEPAANFIDLLSGSLSVIDEIIKTGNNNETGAKSIPISRKKKNSFF